MNQLEKPASTDTEAFPLVLPLAATEATLAMVGGKGANLVKLARAGLPVPSGFLITTLAYRQFVVANGLGAWILAQVAAIDPTDLQALEATAQAIRQRFLAGNLPASLATAISQAYETSEATAVAVRSSATAEDLPELSFAGQQDTYLNIVGPESLHESIKGCWASLWTARAIGYRARNEIDHTEVALAVVVQAMVQSEASGVLFTANPLTGNRHETVIDATIGLGEALVSGQVEPDHYVVASSTGQILHKTLGAKSLAIRGQAGGGTFTETHEMAQTQALPDAAIHGLAVLGQQVAALYDTPQDIEWAWADGQLALLQTRPITSLFPVPWGAKADPLDVYLSFGTLQGVLDPLTPLGRDAFALLIAGSIGRLFGLGHTLDQQRIFWSAGERLWIRITPMLENRIGRRLVYGFAGVADAGIQQALATILQEPTWATPGWPKPANIQTVLHFARQLAPRFVRSLADPDRSRQIVQQALQDKLRTFRQQVAEAKTLAAQITLLEEELPRIMAIIFPVFIGGAVPGILMMNRLLALANHHWADDPTQRARAWEITRGLPHNVTTEMDLALWQAAHTIRRDQPSLSHFQRADATALAADYLAHRLPAVAQQIVAKFLASYGQRGVAEIDLGRVRWQEEPTQVLQMIQSYLRIDDPEQAPDVQFRRGAETAHSVLAALQHSLRHTPFGPFKAALAGWMAKRFRALAGLRESPKFFIVQLLGLLRAALLQSSTSLVERGLLAQADDIFYLHVAELKALVADYAIDWRALVAERRALYQREQRRRQIPRLLLSDGRAFYAGVQHAEATSANQLLGVPVSPGIVEGIVHLVFEPHKAQLAPGEILVCPGTDPAWTPLFLAAGGLVMEVGGLMTHGSVVAREYGIPAVVGVHEATSRLQSGQRIRVNGSTGEISVLE